MSMTRALFVVGIWSAGLVAGCTKKASEPAVAADPVFDSKWQSLAGAGGDVMYIGDDQRGEGLMGSVRRAAPPKPAPIDDKPAADEVLPELLPGTEIAQVIRTNLPAVKQCYVTVARRGAAAGKAIVSFSIGPDGRPAEVKIEAPTFQGTTLPQCLSNQVSFWSFPKSQKGGGAVSYPFVFMGG